MRDLNLEKPHASCLMPRASCPSFTAANKLFFFLVNVFLGSLEYTALCDMINCQ